MVTKRPHRAASSDRRDLCEACGSPGGPDVLLEIPVPVEVFENLGLDLLDLVNLTPISVKQSIHAHLIQVFEI